MTETKIRIYLEDEAPRIGSGWRTVSVKIGRKWTYITDTATKRRARLKRVDADKILKHAENFSFPLSLYERGKEKKTTRQQNAADTTEKIQ